MTSYAKTQLIWKGWWKTKKNYGRNTNSSKHRTKSNYIAAKCKENDLDLRSICELGVGSGRHLAIFHQYYPEAEYYANDISKTALKQIKKYNPEVEQFATIKVIDTLSFLRTNEREFDAILTYGHLMHLPEDVIIDVLSYISNTCKYLICYEAICKTGKYNKDKEYRFERDYTYYFPDAFMPILIETDTNQCLYIMRTNNA